MDNFFKEIKLTDSKERLNLDALARNILTKADSVYYSIKRFAKLKKNNGVFAEDIIRKLFGAINLNHFEKNHPHVDLAITVPIENVTVKNEIISVKSSINKKASTSKVLSDSKSIKLDSLFSYLIFAHSNYRGRTDDDYSVKKELKDYIIETMGIKDFDYIKLVNVMAYHYLFNIDAASERISVDFDKLLKGVNLAEGTYEEYEKKVIQEISKLTTPISIAICYIEPSSRVGEDTKCIIKKTHTIPLREYWMKVIQLWSEKKYFGKVNKNGDMVVKYLSFEDIKSIYGLGKNSDLPIEININTDTFNYSSGYVDKTDAEKITHQKETTERKSRRLKLATDLRDANFGKSDKKIVAFFKATIDSLVSNPKLVKRFNSFLPRENRVNLKRYKDS